MKNDNVETVKDQLDTDQSKKETTETGENQQRQSFKDKFNQGPEEKVSMTKEETLKFYEDNLPLMRSQDEYDELSYRFKERRVKLLELQVREVESVGYLSQWKAGQDAASAQQIKEKEAQEKAKAEWEAMSPEEQEEWKKKAMENIERLEKQAKGELGHGVLYDGTNAGEVVAFVNGGPVTEIEVNSEDGSFSFSTTKLSGESHFMTILPGTLIERNEEGELIVSHN